MAAKFNKVPVKLRDFSTPIDKRFLDALAIMRFNKPYDKVKEQTNTLLRDLIGLGERIHPQDVHFIILNNIMPSSELPLRKRSGLPRNSQLMSGY
jgi:hypothetical protein